MQEEKSELNFTFNFNPVVIKGSNSIHPYIFGYLCPQEQGSPFCKDRADKTSSLSNGEVHDNSHHFNLGSLGKLILHTHTVLFTNRTKPLFCP